MAEDTQDTTVAETDTETTVESTESTTGETEVKKAPKKTSKKGKSLTSGTAFVYASFNNTIVTIADNNGNVVAASSAGASGFKGARKSTAYAAQVAAENAIEKAKNFGLSSVNIRIKGVGAGREQAIRGIQAKDIDILSIIDTTPVPHNGCRKKKVRRV